MSVIEILRSNPDLLLLSADDAATAINAKDKENTDPTFKVIKQVFDRLVAAKVLQEDVAAKMADIATVSLAEQLKGEGAIIEVTEVQEAMETMNAEQVKRDAEAASMQLRNQVAAQYNAVFSLLSSGQTALAKQTWEAGLALFE